MTEPVHLKVINNIPNYAYSQPKISKKKIQAIMRKYEIDDDVIDNVNEDFFIGYEVARNIIIKMLKDEYDLSKSANQDFETNSNESENDYER